MYFQQLHFRFITTSESTGFGQASVTECGQAVGRVGLVSLGGYGSALGFTKILLRKRHQEKFRY